MSSKWPKKSRSHPFRAFSNTHTCTHAQNKKKLSKPWCSEMLNIWWEKHSAYHRSRSHQCKLLQVQAAVLSVTSNSVVREVAPHLYHRKRRNEFVPLFPATTREWKYQLKDTHTEKKKSIAYICTEKHRHRGKNWQLYLYRHIGLILRLLSPILKQISHPSHIKWWLQNHPGYT